MSFSDQSRHVSDALVSRDRPTRRHDQLVHLRQHLLHFALRWRVADGDVEGRDRIRVGGGASDGVGELLGDHFAGWAWGAFRTLHAVLAARDAEGEADEGAVVARLHVGFLPGLERVRRVHGEVRKGGPWGSKGPASSRYRR